MKFVLFFLTSLILLACGQKQIDVSYLQRKLSDAEKMKWLLAEEQLAALDLSDEGKRFLKDFYAQRHYKPCWIEKSKHSGKAKALFALFRNPLALGLPEKRYLLPVKEKHYLLDEIRLTHQLAAVFQDLKFGMLVWSDTTLRPLSYPVASQFEEKIKFSSNRKHLYKHFLQWGPADSNYQKLADGLYRFATSYPLNDFNYKVISEKKDSTEAHTLARKSLFSKGYLRSDTISDSLYFLALQQFQVQNGLEPDAVIGEMTAEALNESNVHKCRRAALVLDKLRALRNTEKRFIEVNIPEYMLRFYADDSLKSVNRVIVGKPANQTPEFNAQLKRLVAYPYWHVPYSIRSKEMLPDAKKNPGYFARNNMLLYSKNTEIDPFSVNWNAIREKTFPYRVVQQPGPQNSLGIIKFEFANPYGVYIHDTPTKRLFKTYVRSYSHGCIRCENPLDLAKIILIKDLNVVLPDSLDSILSRENNHSIRLKQAIAVKIVYRTVTSPNPGQIIFFRDIYKRDEQFLDILFPV